MDEQDEEVRLLLNRTRAARERLNAKMNANGKTSPINQGLRYFLKYNRWLVTKHAHAGTLAG